jgi:hypothetical protein
VNIATMRANHFILLLLICCAMRFTAAHAQTSEQLMQLMMSQPHADINVPVTATSSFDPPIVRPGEKSVYRVTFNATSDASSVTVKWPDPMPAPSPLKLRQTVGGHNVQALGGAIQMFSTFNFDARSAEAGAFTVPEYTVEVYGKPVTVPAAQLEVNSALPEPHEMARELLVQPSATNVFAGEIFSVSVLLPATAAGAVEGVSDVRLNGDGFVVDKNAVRQSIRPVELNGLTMPAYIYETSLTPITAGKINLTAQGFTAGMNFGGPISITGQLTIPGGPPKILLLDSEPVTINVRPLPVENELPGFTGIIGNYFCDPPRLATNSVKIGEPVQLTMVVRGQQNLDRINPPPPPRVQGWQIFPATRGAIVAEPGTTNRGVNFSYTLIPLTSAVQSTPAIPFSCFNPARGNYVDLTIPSLPLTVVSDGMMTNADQALMLVASSFESGPKSGLSKLAQTPGWTTGSLVPLQLRGWFPLVQIFPVLIFCGLWFWDRRRRYLELHPEIVRRRQARRALRRELRLLEQNADAGDAVNFVQRGVHALQIASAPHYPAAPRALVCGDVLPILTAPERAGKSGEIVRRFFAAADAAAFANVSETQTGLLAEKSALKETLSKLEARL